MKRREGRKEKGRGETKDTALLPDSAEPLTKLVFTAQHSSHPMRVAAPQG